MRVAFAGGFMAFATIAASMLGCTKTCTLLGTYGLDMTLVDAQTRRPICDADVVVSDGTHTERLMQYPSSNTPCSYQGLLEQPGEFEVFVARAGYRPLTISSVEVHMDNRGCDVEGVSLRDVELHADPDAAPDSDAGS